MSSDPPAQLTALVFSSRLPTSLAPNRLTIARGRQRAVIDLTESNPTRAGIEYAPALLAPLGDARGLIHAPRPLGLDEAREAVAADYRRRGLTVPAEHVVMTASTSEAYSLLFKLLCNPGDQVLVPRPSYPLVEHLAKLEAVEVVPYELDYHGTWCVSRESLVSGVTERTRAVVVVTPNNPTGSVVKSDELSDVGALCQTRGLALIGDEVFADYPLKGDRLPGPSVLAEPAALTFGFGGLSKSIGLPQVKLGWIGVGGPADLVRATLDRLEVICDAYLSVSTPVQLALTRLLRDGAIVRDRIGARIRANFQSLRRQAATHPACTLLDAEAGWYAVLQVPAVVSEETLVLDLLEQAGVLLHPGYFFDFSREAFLVVSLLTSPDAFGAGVERLFLRLEELSPS